MKLLTAKPPIPPYLHLGSVALKSVVLTSKSGRPLAVIDDEWRMLSVKIYQQPALLREVLKRLDERAADPNYTDEPFQVFCTLTEDRQGRILLDFFY